MEGQALYSRGSEYVYGTNRTPHGTHCRQPCNACLGIASSTQSPSLPQRRIFIALPAAQDRGSDERVGFRGYPHERAKTRGPALSRESMLARKPGPYR